MTDTNASAPRLYGGYSEEQLRGLAEAATPGPWKLDDEMSFKDYAAISYEDAAPGESWSALAQVVVRMDGMEDDDPEGRANAALIAASRTAIPALLDRIEEQAAEIARLREALTEAAEDFRLAALAVRSQYPMTAAALNNQAERCAALSQGGSHG